MPTKLILPGRSVETAAQFESDLSDFLNVEIKRVQVVDAAARGTTGGTEQAFEDAEETDIVEREWANGVRQWVSVAQLRQDIGQAGGGGGTRSAVAASSELRVTGATSFDGASRGAFDWALKGLKILRISPTEKAAKWTAQQIVEHFEGQLKPAAGLYRLSKSMESEERRLTASDLKASDPYLVFVHGTASTTAGSFGRLAGTKEWDQLQQQYPQRALGFQHRTMSESPIQNALELATLLPAKARLHLVTHSRGGLVGELLCLGPLGADDFEPFLSAQRETDAALLKELSDVLAAKDFQIEKFVRVACPARGTILASKRLDLYFSIILNLIGLLPALQASPVYSFVKATLLELAKRRTRPDELPGIEAMMPESPVIHLLNRPGVTTKGDLAVIAGDIEGAGVWGSLKTMATDLFYLENHDLVVNTEAMYGGMNREQGAYFFFDQGPEVNHFSYFANARTRERMLSWLTQTDGRERDDLFQRIPRGEDNLVIKQTRAAAAGLPVVFLVPGIMGTHLRDNRGRVWLNFLALALGGIKRLTLNGAGVTPDALVAMAYQKLADFLVSEYRVVPFPYDWRKSILDEGQRLASEIRGELDAHQKPVRIIAHSMGGLVARAMFAQNPKLWKEVCERDGRLIMLGTPNLGSFIIPSLLLGKEKILRQLALLDFRHRLHGVVDIVRRFPGLLEMLPEIEGGPNFFDPAWWGRMPGGFPPPDAGDLKRAKESREKIAKAKLPPQLVYVAGTAAATPSALRIDADEVVFETTPDGDGRVLHHPASYLDQTPTLYMDAGHGDMANHQPSFPALLELLNTGKTSKLAVEPRRHRSVAVAAARSRRDAATTAIAGRDAEPLLFPREDEMVAAALGASDAARTPAEETHTLRVSIAHCDLARASHPVAVGHYLGDSIVSAEARLDRKLDYRLSKLFAMQLYPGRIGTTEVVYQPDSQPQGALVVGLGEVGGITPEIVRRGITNAALRYALVVANEAGPADTAAPQRNGRRNGADADGTNATGAPAHKWRSAAFSTLLIGTYGGNALSVASSVSSIIQGVMKANQALRAQNLWDQVRIDEVQIVELYEDIAVQAVRAAYRVEENPPGEDGAPDLIAVDPPYLQALGGGRYQRPNNQYDTGWWRRIQITGERDKQTNERTGNLRYLVLTDRARAEDTLQSTQLKLINNFIDKAINDPVYDERLAATLFELLLPNALKARAEVEANLLLVLDDASAQYPWELLAQRTRAGSEPLASRMGMIRQLATTSYQPAPQATRDRRALVVGVSQAFQYEEGYFPALPGARQEAEEVARVIAGAGYQVGAPLIDADGITIVSELLTKEHRILHLAGHGVYNANDPKRSGMVLGGDTFLATTELQSLSFVPELAFINCCHLGHIDEQRKPQQPQSPHRLAASIAQELINKGVRAVVAAGWAVDDGAASAFARIFYETMFSGEPFGEAVKRAREETRRQFPHTNTWGAYQCYGNPGFVLEEQGKKKGAAADKAAGLYSRREYVEALLTITEGSSGAAPEWKAELGGQLDQLDKALPDIWRDGAVLNEFGKAWAALGDFARAIDYYRRAIQQDGAEAPLCAVEQLANILSRHAEALREQAQASGAQAIPPEIKPLIDEAFERLAWASQLGDTAERLSLFGGIYKRLAMTADDGPRRRKSLEQARDYYGKAYQHSDKKGALDFYPTLNWLTCRFLLGDAKLKGAQKLPALIDDCKKAAARQAQKKPDFWNRIAVPEADLLALLINGKLPANVTALIKQYQKVIGDGPKPDELDTLRKHYGFIIEMVASQNKPGHARTVKALEDLLEGMFKGIKP